MPNAPPVGRDRFIAPSALSMDCGDWHVRWRNKAIAPYGENTTGGLIRPDASEYERA